MTISSISKLADQGIRSLRKSLWAYWPARHGNDMPERNITAHTAHVFLKAGWLIYAEPVFPRSSQQHLDLMALHKSSRTMIAIEAKRLYEGEKAKNLAEDAQRIRNFKLVQKNAEFMPKKRFGLLLAFTWQPEIRKWWIAGKHAMAPKGHRGAGWKLLGRTLDKSRVISGAGLLTNYPEDRANPKYRKCWGLYAIYKL